ncbi:MAG: hypothetical protein ABF461_06720 [Zymomonas mobilis subsp. pomaceae]|uniref:hypothetical protein n=1 Tax=Zymomonas mobilis TaxID=542 RepID=UPI0002FF6193|nr:hypothetical protein [Zymomonas mobilis]MDX5948206.1 hypothetical protein [Zymomonas mobilis subsp. pomaceae]
MRSKLKRLIVWPFLSISVSSAQSYYRECDLAKGNKFFCRGWYSGKAIIKDK